MEQPYGYKWNLVIFESFAQHYYLEGCYDDFKTANEKGHEICDGNGRDYKVMSEMEYIQFKNPYYKD